MGIYFSENVDGVYFFIYFFNFITLAFIFGIIGILCSKKINFIETPKKSKRQVNKKLYRLIFYFLTIISVTLLLSMLLNINQIIIIGELILVMILLFGYLTKPLNIK